MQREEEERRKEYINFLTENAGIPRRYKKASFEPKQATQEEVKEFL